MTKILKDLTIIIIMSFIVSKNQNDKPVLSKLNTQDIHFSDVKFIGKTNPRKVVNITYGSYEDKLTLQSPKMKIPYEIKGQTFDGITKYDINISFNDDDPKHRAFKETIKQIDNHMKEVVCNNDELSRKWLKQKAPSMEVAEALYNSMLKVHKNKDTGEPSGLWPDSLRIKLPFYKKYNEEEGKFGFDLFDCDTKEKVDNDSILENLKKGSSCRLLIENTGVYFVNGKYGLSWKVVQGSVSKPKQTYQSYSFVEDEDEDSRDEDVQSLDSDE